MITVKLFAMLRDKAGASEVILAERPATVGDLMVRVGDRCPGIRDLLACGRILVSVNQEFVKQDFPASLVMQAEDALVPSTDGTDPAFKLDVYSSQADFAQGIVRVDLAVRPVRAIDFIYATVLVQV